MSRFIPLASGSKGNSLLLETDETTLLIDCGLSGKALAERLSAVDLTIDSIDAILITHEHGDHISGLRVAERFGIPVFANSETARAIRALYDGHLTFKIFTTGETFNFCDLEISPFSIQHDTADPVAFTIQTSTAKLGISADLGIVTTTVRSQLEGCDYLYLEANHQPSMVHASPRPMVYKQRVLSRYGHLSNEEAGKLLCDVWHSHLKKVYLAHLSEECNSPETALSVVRHFLSEKNLSVDLTIAHQARVSEAIHF